MVVFKDKDYMPVGVYVHWHGDAMPSALEKAGPGLRTGDASYASARFCAWLGAEIKGPLGLGLMPGPTAEDEAEGFKGYSQGDAGVLIVDVMTGEVTPYAGYLVEKGAFTINMYRG